MQWFRLQNRFYGVFLISFSLSSETETPSCIPTQLSVVQKVEFSISFLILPLEGDITHHFSAENAAGWLVSTPSRCQWGVKQVKKIKISMFHVNKNGFFFGEKGQKKEMKWKKQIQAVITQEGRMSLKVLGLADNTNYNLLWTTVCMLILSLFGKYV